MSKRREGFDPSKGFIASFKTPLDGHYAATLAALLIQYPEHHFKVTGDRLELWPGPAPEMISVPRPHVPYGPSGLSKNDADVKYLRQAAHDLEEFYKPFGRNLRDTVVQLLRDSADAIGGK